MNENPIVYDTRISPPTYGDFLFVVMLARWAQTAGWKTDFTILTGWNRRDWEDITPEAGKILIEDYVRIASLVLGFDVKTEERQVEKRGEIMLYRHALNSLNGMVANQSPAMIEKFLLRAEEFSGQAKRIPEEPYISWHCRHNEKWSPERNTTDEGFVSIRKKLGERFPGHSIMVISNDTACERFRAIPGALPCLYAKDYTEADSFLGRMELVLRSKFYYAFLGGGMSVVPMFSQLPYEMRFPTIWEKPWGEGKFTSWAREDQIFHYPNYNG